MLHIDTIPWGNNMKSLLIRSALIILAHIGTVHALVVTFEGATPYGSAVIPNPYNGIVWRGFGVINQSHYLGTDYGERSGSGDFYAYNLSGERSVSITTANHDFIMINSAQISSFMDDALTLSFNGRGRTSDWYSKIVLVGREMALIEFGWDVDRIEIYATSSLGEFIWGDPTKFLMDNLRFNESPATVVSEPSVLLLVLGSVLIVLSYKTRSYLAGESLAV